MVAQLLNLGQRQAATAAGRAESPTKYHMKVSFQARYASLSIAMLVGAHAPAGFSQEDDSGERGSFHTQDGRP